MYVIFMGNSFIYLFMICLMVMKVSQTVILNEMIVSE
jgi:hypothetical protein